MTNENTSSIRISPNFSLSKVDIVKPHPHYVRTMAHWLAFFFIHGFLLATFGTLLCCSASAPAWLRHREITRRNRVANSPRRVSCMFIYSVGVMFTTGVHRGVAQGRPPPPLGPKNGNFFLKLLNFEKNSEILGNFLFKAP